MTSDTDNHRRTHALSFSRTAPKQKASSGDNSRRRCENASLSRGHCTGTSNSTSDENVTDAACVDMTIQRNKTTQWSLKFDDLDLYRNAFRSRRKKVIVRAQTEVPNGYRQTIPRPWNGDWKYTVAQGRLLFSRVVTV